MKRRAAAPGPLFRSQRRRASNSQVVAPKLRRKSDFQNTFEGSEGFAWWDCHCCIFLFSNGENEVGPRTWATVFFMS